MKRSSSAVNARSSVELSGDAAGSGLALSVAAPWLAVADVAAAGTTTGAAVPFADDGSCASAVEVTLIAINTKPNALAISSNYNADSRSSKPTNTSAKSALANSAFSFSVARTCNSTFLPSKSKGLLSLEAKRGRAAATAHRRILELRAAPPLPEQLSHP
ncbi:MAG TPA: hypothetical protein VHB79_04055 [Polyangiaceae bacterium]|nr:hypothetical protein [Polyangiaceae bacterium]